MKDVSTHQDPEPVSSPMERRADRHKRGRRHIWSNRQKAEHNRWQAEPLRTFPVALALILALGAVCLVLAFRGGAYVHTDWLPFVLVAAAVALVVFAVSPLPALSRGQIALLGAYLLLAVWTAASILWATSPGNAWEETNRTLFYLVALVLAALAVRLGGRRGPAVLAAIVLGEILVVAAAIVIRLASASNPAQLFASGRLNYPVTYWNGLAALLMLGFWLALGLANRGSMLGEGGAAGGAAGGRPSRRALSHLRPLLPAAAVVLAELALLPQSRGALWSFFLVVPWFVLLSPHRFRALTNLVIVCLPVAFFWDRLTHVYGALRGGTGAQTAVHTALAGVGWSVLAVLVLAFATGLLERAIGPLHRRLSLRLGIALVLVVCVAFAAGLVVLDQRTEGLSSFVSTQWQRITSDQGPTGDTASRLTEFGFSGRLEQWRLAAQAFRAHPLLGLGAQNYEFFYYQHRSTPAEVRQPHSQPMQFLAELGAPGLTLAVLFVAGVLLRAGVVRFRARERRYQATVAAMLCASLSWLIHSAADWLWQLGAVSLPAVLLLGGLLAVPHEDLTGETARPQTMTVRAARLAGIVLAVAIFLSAMFPWLSLRYTNLANRNARLAPATAISQTFTAGRLNPLSPLPAMTRATIAASTRTTGLENLAIAAAAWQEAVQREPGSWLTNYQAGISLLNYHTATEPSPAGTSSSEEQAPRGLFTEGLLATTVELQREVESIQSLTMDQLTARARAYLEKARELNPLNTDVVKALTKL